MVEKGPCELYGPFGKGPSVPKSAQINHSFAARIWITGASKMSP